MTNGGALRTRRDFLSADGVLLVTRDPPAPPAPAPGQPPIVPGDPAEGPEILLSVWADGRVVALNGHVDLGTGIRTALAQIVADELDVPLARVEMILGDTARAPNQGPTIASASLQLHAAPLRCDAAQARGWLIARAAQHLGADPADPVALAGLTARDGRVGGIPFEDLVGDQRTVLALDTSVALKPPGEYRIVGQSVPRIDIPAKVAGDTVFVHDLRLPGMLHGRVIRPPYAGADHGDFIGNTLESVDETSIAHIPGIRAVVVIRDFVGIVAEREEHAEQAAAALVVRWKAWPGLPPVGDIEQALRANPSTPRRLVDDGDVESGLAAAAQTLERTYLWPYQMHASIGPSCAVAQWHAGESGDASPHRLTVWAGTQNPHALRVDLARLFGLEPPSIEVCRMEASGCYGRNGADDVAADAALLAQGAGAPVRVQLSREQENLWDPKGAAQWMTVHGGLREDGSIAGWDFTTTYPSNGAPTLALLLTRRIEPVAQAFEMGDRTARPPYAVPDLRVTVNDMAPILRASWLRGVSALPNSFAHESFVDELATAAAADPLTFRLRHLKDERAAELLRATAARAGWLPHTKPRQQAPLGDRLRGQGVAYARYVHSKWPGFGAAWSAWVADVEVDRRSGEVHVSRVVVGHDAGLMVNPAGVQHQIHGNVLQTTSRALKERVDTDPTTHALTSRDWGAYPILNFREVPIVDVMSMPRPGEPPLGAGESSSVPGTAAIANAIFDATGVRFRQPPFTPEVIRAALNALPSPAATSPAATSPAATSPATTPTATPTGLHPAPRDPRWPAAKRWWVRAAALAVGAVGLGAALLGARTTIAPVTRPDASVYTAATIERGRQLAALGNCVGCHTTPGAAPLAGGRALETPFGVIHSTNLTPDVDTGLGAWSFSAFQRAMREGVSRDGHRLYPAFPYTAFTRTTDDDLTAIYAWLMAQPAARAPTPPAALAFPYSVRPLMTLWNALYLTPGAVPVEDPGRNAQWNRGAYLVNGLGHCGACHTGRDALGAERVGSGFLAGAVIDGWEAPALTSATRAPVPWTEDELFRYLRQGHGEWHGIAAGPMAPVVTELGALPDGDVRAMAHYLASFGPPTSDALARTDQARTDQARTDEAHADAAARSAIAAARATGHVLAGPAQRMFDAACSACHHDGDGPRLLGVNRPLALNSNLHSDRPDNLIRVILDGIREPATPDLGFMPAFRGAYDDRQIADLAAYLRARYAPGRPAWGDLEANVARLRARSDSAARVSP